MPNPLIFDRQRLKLHRDRAARAGEDFLLREIVERVIDRLADIKRDFTQVLDLGAHHGLFKHMSGLANVVETDVSFSQLANASGLKVVCDEEFLPFAPNSFDLVVSCGSLHWVNDLPGTLIQIQHILKPDGLFLAMIPGGETLKELRASFEAAEMAAKGGISPRVSPFVDIRDAGMLLQRAGFALPVVDSELLELAYEHPLKLLHEIRRMGETNCLLESQKTFTPCSLMMQMVDHYVQHFSRTEDSRISATIELVTLTAWKPHSSQQQPAKRGSGQANLGKVLN